MKQKVIVHRANLENPQRYFVDLIMHVIIGLMGSGLHDIHADSL